MSQLHLNEIETSDVVVVGGGLAGLAAAATAARAGRRTVLLDAHRLGGRAATDERGGFIFNRGPRALYADGPGRRVLDDLGVSTDHGDSPAPGAVGRRRGRLHLLPHGPWSLLRTGLITGAEKVKLGRCLIRLPRLDPDAFAGASAEEAVASFDLGPEGRELLAALVRLATYTDAAEMLDGAAAVRQLQMAADGGVVYLDAGWATLVDGLADVARRSGAALTAGTAVREIASHEGVPLVITTDGRRIAAEQIVVATGGPEAVAALLGARPPGSATLGPPTAAACLELGLRRPPTTRFVLGIDEPLYLSTHCPPADLAPPGGAVVHVMRYLHQDEDLPSAAVRDQLVDLARSTGIADADIVEQRFLARMVVTGGIPTTEGGLSGRPSVEVPGSPGMLLAGDWVGDEGLLADAALASGARAGRLAAERSATLAVP